MRIENAIIIPVSGIESSLVGFSINNWTLRMIDPYSNGNSIFENVADDQLYKYIESALEFEELFSRMRYISIAGIPAPCYAFIKETDSIDDFEIFVAAARLCKTSKFCCWNPLKFQFGQLMPEGRAYNYPLAPDDLSMLEEDDIPVITCILNAFSKGKYPEIVGKMLLFFNEAYSTPNIYMGFILRVIVLEMLISGNSELTFRLRHSIAVLLGRDIDESVRIDADVKQIYEARSKFLHDGAANKIDEKLTDKAIEYSRRLILNLLGITESIDEIRTKLDRCGFGDNPYNITL